MPERLRPSNSDLPINKLTIAGGVAGAALLGDKLGPIGIAVGFTLGGIVTGTIHHRIDVYIRNKKKRGK